MKGDVPEPQSRIAELLSRARTRFRRLVPSGWNWRRVVVGIVLAEVAAALLLLTFVAFTGKHLTVSFSRPVAPPPTLASARLTIPVAGVMAGELADTWGAPRTPTRDHLGIDIHAPAGTPVLAASPGVIVRLDTSGAGGITIHERGLDGRTVFYYAHLQRYAPGLEVGDLVRQADTIGFVGDSGNAAGVPHLHFAVYTVSDPNQVSDGRHLNPYLLLVDTL